MKERDISVIKKKNISLGYREKRVDAISKFSPLKKCLQSPKIKKLLCSKREHSAAANKTNFTRDVGIHEHTIKLTRAASCRGLKREKLEVSYKEFENFTSENQSRSKRDIFVKKNLQRPTYSGIKISPEKRIICTAIMRGESSKINQRRPISSFNSPDVQVSFDDNFGASLAYNTSLIEEAKKEKTLIKKPGIRYSLTRASSTNRDRPGSAQSSSKIYEMNMSNNAHLRNSNFAFVNVGFRGSQLSKLKQALATSKIASNYGQRK